MVRALATAAMLLTPAASIAQQAAPLLMPGEALVQVSATGEVKATPDIAEVSAAVVTDAADGKAALAANAVKAGRLIDALHAAGVPDGALRTSDLAVRPRHRPDKDGDDTDEVIGYRATNRVSARLPAAEAGRIVDALAVAGATEIDGPRFSFADEPALLRRARDVAVKTAQQRGRDYADAFSLRTLRVVRVSERGADVAGAGDIVVTGSRVMSSPVKPGEQTVSVTVWIDYAVTR